ncbi:SOS response-associated peptidase family protein [Rhizobacter sp. SG703]|uniref:SOS response-associated peptidase n=1 Tax=Rhizobacter sp. SG703 TaxID=2587140 RepID=UPI001445B50B|nr:SOS response-associated peptidase family protein [Rhizobacter sp. SG703]NKI97523.1 putative SOS response-associated peptidase YedK [Rhizobacter sp. SG703]
MCTRYVSPEDAAIERFFHIGRRDAWRGPRREMFPGYVGPFIRPAKDITEPVRELVAGQWNLIPWFAKEPKLKFATCNARSEELAGKASYKLPWARGQRCIIPAEAFYEPNWDTGKHIPWRFKRADGDMWALAGIWNAWVDRASGEIHESYTMLTINADGHALMGRMHKPDPKRPPHMQDKRSVVPIALADVDHWLFASVDEAKKLLVLPAVELFDASPATAPSPPSAQVDLADE